MQPTRMVDISHKSPNQRVATAKGLVVMKPETLTRLRDDKLPKAKALTVAQAAGITAAKQTSQLIPK